MNGSAYNTAGGFFFDGEYNMVRWMEKMGYDVTYTTDVDTDAATDMINGPLSPGRHKVFLSVGHDEYWSWQMRENIEKARNRSMNQQPLNLGFFGANSVYWQIRFANSSPANTAPAGQPRRTMIAYKELATSDQDDWKDPFYTFEGSPTNYLTTTLWRNMRNPNMGTQCPSPSDCFKYPEDELIGVMTNLANPGGRGDFEFAPGLPQNHWMKRNVDNPGMAFTGLVGYEADMFYTANYPGRAMTEVVGDSEFIGKLITRAHAVYYVMSGGARVFAAGTIEWGLGLDGFGGSAEQRGPLLHPDYYDSRLEVTTTNILICLRDGGAACVNS